MVGLSLSLCISDIIEGRVKEEDVSCIITGTRARTLEDWASIARSYNWIYWRNSPDQATAIMYRLISIGKVWQPRLAGWAPPFIGDGIWIEEGEDYPRCF